MTFLISDNQQDYHKFVAEAVEMLRAYEIEGIAIVALTPEANLTAYWNLDLRGKTIAQSEIEMDRWDNFLQANTGRYDLTE